MIDYQGPAPFDDVIQQAAKIRAEREHSAKAAKEARFQQLINDCKNADDALDGRRRRKEKDQKWAQHHDLIAKLTESKLTDFQIAGRLCDLGFIVNRYDVYSYQRRSGLRVAGERICGGVESVN